MNKHLSRVRWSMGQALLPEHLFTLESSILADSALRFNLHEIPNYGFYSLRWNETLLTEGMLSLDEMTLVLPSGLLLVLKENANIITLNLNISGSSFVSVYLHVNDFPENIGDRGIEQRVIERNNVNCWLWALDLSSEQEDYDALESFHFADFEKHPDGSWQLSKRYIPPLISLGSMPFLKDELTELIRKLEAYHYQLAQEIATIYLSGDDLTNARQCQRSIVQTLRFMANLFSEIPAHPYHVYEQLKSFYVELCFYHNNIPKFATSPYRHEELGEVFREIFDPLTEQLRFSETRSPYLPFTVSGELIRIKLPESIREAKEIYLLVQKGAVTKDIDLNDVKIAAISRISVVHKFYLQGIPFKHIDRPSFQHSFGPEVDIYQLTIGDEWDHALNELELGFYADSKFAEEKFFLYWRAD
ncbi:MAG: hypothetical protein GQ569_04345 [Methylococcaceae bacterium]|nr:hypothetical protein [Methylococcaceae bacterium]